MFKKWYGKFNILYGFEMVNVWMYYINIYMLMLENVYFFWKYVV